MQLQTHIIFIDKQPVDSQQRSFLKQLESVVVPICQELKVKYHLERVDKLDTQHFADGWAEDKHQDSKDRDCEVDVEGSGIVGRVMFVDERTAVGFGSER